MARRSSILDDLVLLPWWFNLIIAFVVYIGLKFILPSVETDSPIFKGIFHALPGFATILSTILCLVAVISAVRSWERGELFKNQTSLDNIKSLTWQKFEQYIGEAYKRKGYFVEETGLGGADGGIDLVLNKDGKRILVQCKNWKARKVGVSVVRELFGVVKSQNASGGLLVTAGSYTEDAKRFANETGIELIDGVRLTRLINSIRDTPLSEQAQPIKASTSDSPLCPRCNSTMIKRIAKKGTNAGNSFWGCSRFPACKGIRN